MPGQLHNMTVYVAREDFERVSAFHRAVFGSEPIWREVGHIACFGISEMAICVHEEEGEHRAGTRELFFWSDNLDQADAELRAASVDVRRLPTADGGEELRATDRWGNAVRVHRRRT